MKVILGSDHAGFSVKIKIKHFLEKNKIEYEDFGTDSSEPVDYPDIAKKVGLRVAKSKSYRGILVCGSGTGMVIAANKINGIRAVAPYDAYTSKMSRIDNDANIIGIRGRGFPFSKIKTIISTWLFTEFSNNSRHKRRIKKIKKLEKNA